MKRFKALIGERVEEIHELSGKQAAAALYLKIQKKRGDAHPKTQRAGALLKAVGHHDASKTSEPWAKFHRAKKGEMLKHSSALREAMPGSDGAAANKIQDNGMHPVKKPAKAPDLDKQPKQPVKNKLSQ